MTSLTLVRYLLGVRGAIVLVAASRWSVWIGALLVLSAGLAREYDGEDLLHEPWRPAVPFAASVATSLLLYALVFAMAKESAGEVLSYRAFLGLYWMTAPLAWLYAIPVERWLPGEEAAQVNMVLLGIVSLWRVALIIRVLSVVTRTRPRVAMMPVLLFADVVVLAGLLLAPWPLFETMGGLRSRANETLLTIKMGLCVLCFLSLPLWIIAVVIGRGKFDLEVPEPDRAAASRRPPWLFWLAVASVLVWVPALSARQPAQQLPRRVERAYATGDKAGAIRLMSEHARADFPPYWSPPPEWGPRETHAGHLEMLQAALAPATADWVRQEYRRRLERFLELLDYRDIWAMGMSDEEFGTLVGTINRLHDRAELAAQHRHALQNLQRLRAEIPEPTRAELQGLLDLAGDGE